MKDFTVMVEFIDGDVDFRTLRANNRKEAEQMAVSQNNNRVGNKMFPNTKEAIKAEAQLWYLMLSS